MPGWRQGGELTWPQGSCDRYCLGSIVVWEGLGVGCDIIMLAETMAIEFIESLSSCDFKANFRPNTRHQKEIGQRLGNCSLQGNSLIQPFSKHPLPLGRSGGRHSHKAGLLRAFHSVFFLVMLACPVLVSPRNIISGIHMKWHLHSSVEHSVSSSTGFVREVWVSAWW